MIQNTQKKTDLPTDEKFWDWKVGIIGVVFAGIIYKFATAEVTYGIDARDIGKQQLEKREHLQKEKSSFDH